METAKGEGKTEWCPPCATVNRLKGGPAFLFSEDQATGPWRPQAATDRWNTTVSAVGCCAFAGSCFWSLQEELEQRMAELVAATSRANEQTFPREPAEIDAVELLTNLAGCKLLAVSFGEGMEES